LLQNAKKNTNREKSALKVKRLERVEEVIGGRVNPSAAANNGILKAQGRTSSGSLPDLKATDRHRGGVEKNAEGIANAVGKKMHSFGFFSSAIKLYIHFSID